MQASQAIVMRNLATGMRVERRVLGQTSLEVSIIGFGASPLGNVFGQMDTAEGVAAVRYAIDSDINFFDVSPYYGLTLAETQLGKALQGYRDRVVLATKCGRYGAKEFDFSAKKITSELEKSLKRLRTEHVDLLQAHDVEFGDVHQIVEETIPAMRVLQRQGKARYIGITGYSLKNLIEIASRVKVDNILTYCRYNLLIDDMEKTLVPFAKTHGISIVNASPLHMGLITKRGAPVWHPAPPEVRQAAQQIVELCASRGYDASELALKYCFDNKDVGSTFVGISSREDVDASLKALQMKGDAELLGDIAKLVKPVRNFVWSSGRVENRG